MVPVAIYKYGIVRPGVLFRFRQRQFVWGLIRRIRGLGGQGAAAGFGSRPDVIAHSFGTWLLGHALLADRTLKVGRVILTGCILRPDFEWQPLIARGQVEAVLNHYGSRDFWARIAHYVIPDSGPAGRRGFDDEAVIQVETAGLDHSGFFFEPSAEKRGLLPALKRLLARIRGPRTRPGSLHGFFVEVWQPFLTQPRERLAALASRVPPATPWRPVWWRGLSWLAVVIVFLGLVVVAVAVVVFGLRDIVLLALGGGPP